MAPKDYVSRGRSPKKAPPPPPPKTPWLGISLVLLLLLGFAGFLWTLKSNPPPAPAPSKDIAEEKDPLPQLSEEEWEFIKTLPEYEVEVEVPEHEDDGKRHLMQCGSFRSPEQAEEMKARIAFQGLEAQVRPSDGSNGRWYRVILGPYDSKRDAEVDRHAIRRGGITTCKIWLWNI